MKLKKLIVAVLAAVMVLSLGAGFAFADGEGKEVVIGHNVKPTEFDMLLYGTPTQFQPIFEGLFDLDPATGEIVPWLAESYEWVDDCTLRVKLKENVTFSNGAPLTPEDVIYSYQRHVDGKGNQMANYNIFDFEKCAAEDEHTVLLVTTEPVGDLLINLSKFSDIVCKEFYETWAAEDPDGLYLRDQTCGTGPYVLEENADTYTTYVRRDDYWDQDNLPDAEKITLKYYDVMTSMIIAFQQGDLDAVIALDDNSVTELQGGDYGELVIKDQNAVDYVCLPEYVPEFQDIRVRQAIAHAIDWNEVAAAGYGSLGVAAGSVLPTTMEEYYKDEGVYEYDPELSKQLLAEAGYENGFTIDCPKCIGAPAVQTMMELIQAYLSVVGITLNYTPGEMSAVMPDVAQGLVNFFLLPCNSAPSVPDPTAVLEHQRNDAMLTALMITDEEYNEKYHDFIHNQDAAARQEDMYYVQDWHKENCWTLPAAQTKFAYAYGPTVAAMPISSAMMAEIQFIELN